jgi:glycosyltransferase involved in cell wall biosynthesis
MKRLTILNVAYPFAAVGPDSVGGAEQVLHRLDRALAAAGHNSIVIAQKGSVAAGTLVEVEPPGGDLDGCMALARERQHSAILTALRRWPIDLVHLHGVDFYGYLPPPPVPVLATLHLPANWYPAAALVPDRPNTWVQCVSAAQHQCCPPSAQLLPPIGNGVPVNELQGAHAKRRFALFLGRICPEKGVHVAIEAAKRAGIALLIAGAVFPYAAHRRYFEEEIAPRLDASRRFIGPATLARKRRLLNAAQCLLVPSLVPETSSLAAREALACGTPVVAFPNGALRETIEHGRTGFLVGDVPAMAEAIDRAPELSADECRRVAAERFSLAAMTDRYLDLYARLAGGQAAVSLAGAA